MRRVNAMFLVLLMCLCLPLVADDKPPIGGVDPDNSDPCVECTHSYATDTVTCGGEPSAGGWSDCVGGWIYLCDGSGDCAQVANCGNRCLIA